MERFFSNSLLLENKTAHTLYQHVKDLPIIDYHCHLDQSKIAHDDPIPDIGELWLGSDHYKWRAMRICGVDEKYITGTASGKEKFIKFASVLEKLIGNPLYYWAHMELKTIFGIDEPLNSQNAERIYEKANQNIKGLTTRELLQKFNVQFIATTDDPIDSLIFHAQYGQLKVSPTFRPDKLYDCNKEYINDLAKSANMQINTLDDLLCALQKRLDFFVSRGCVMSDHGLDKFPQWYAQYEQAKELFSNADSLTDEQKEGLKGFLLVWLTTQYAKRNITMQIHFAVTRNVNPYTFKTCGVDSGFDVISETPSVQNVLKFFQQVSDDERPQTVLYTLNDSNLPAIACITGAFKKVRMGAAWWFNDTVEGIRKNLKTICEYSVLGNNLGMLTDSRSFASYVRFDFYRRILCSFVGEKVEKGEYDSDCAIKLIKDICYNNAFDIVKNAK